MLGVGATDVERRALGEVERRAIVENEIGERLAAAQEYERTDHHEAAERLRAEARHLAPFLARPR